MSRRLPPLNPLRAVEATARHGSVAEAARELNVTPGAISHQIRAFEAQMGAPIFERHANRLRPTGQAAPFLAAVAAAFEQIAAASAALTRPSARGDLRVACVPALMQFWLIPRIARFFSAFPEVRLTLAPSNDPEEIHSADLCLLYGDGDWPGAHVSLWSELELFPVASPAALAGTPLRSVRDLEGHAILHADEGREWRIWRAALDLADARPAREHFLSDAGMAIQAAVHGAGVALGDSFTTADFLRRGLLVAPYTHAAASTDSFWLVARPERRTAAVLAFEDWLCEERDAEGARVDAGAAGRAMLRRRAARPDAGAEG